MGLFTETSIFQKINWVRKLLQCFNKSQLKRRDDPFLVLVLKQPSPFHDRSLKTLKCLCHSISLWSFFIQSVFIYILLPTISLAFAQSFHEYLLFMAEVIQPHAFQHWIEFSFNVYCMQCSLFFQLSIPLLFWCDLSFRFFEASFLKTQHFQVIPLTKMLILLSTLMNLEYSLPKSRKIESSLRIRWLLRTIWSDDEQIWGERLATTLTALLASFAISPSIQVCLSFCFFFFRGFIQQRKDSYFMFQVRNACIN